MKEVIVATPRGFCAGVVRAVELAEAALEAYGKPVYLVHQLVHNDNVCRDLEAKGAVFVDKLEDIPEGGVVVFSAHGSPPAAYDIARSRNLAIVDATCPLVTRVHNEVKKYGQDRPIAIIGHINHVEVQGTLGHAKYAGTQVHVIDPDSKELESQVVGFGSDAAPAVVTQTTLSQEDVAPAVEAIQREYPMAVIRDDICYATGNRQKAVKQLAEECDVVLVIGSHQSSNSQRLREVSDNAGCRAYLVPDADAVPWFWVRPAYRVGVTSGASTPDNLVEEVVERLVAAGYQRRDRVVVEENIRFREGVLP